MPINPFVEQRKFMKDVLFQMLEAHPTSTEEKVIAIFCAKTGIREKTALQYLKEIKATGIFGEGKEKPLKRQKTLNGREV